MWRSEFNAVSHGFLRGNTEQIRKLQKFVMDELKNKSVVKFLMGHKIIFQCKYQMIPKKQNKNL